MTPWKTTSAGCPIKTYLDTHHRPSASREKPSFPPAGPQHAAPHAVPGAVVGVHGEGLDLEAACARGHGVHAADAALLIAGQLEEELQAICVRVRNMWHAASPDEGGDPG
jgi:hypothetical protein